MAERERKRQADRERVDTADACIHAASDCSQSSKYSKLMAGIRLLFCRYMTRRVLLDYVRSLDGKRAEEGLQKVALASRARQHNGIERVFDSVWKGYLKLDHEIDDGFGGNPAPQRAKAAAIPSGGTSGTRQRADRDLEASIADLKKEKQAIRQYA